MKLTVGICTIFALCKLISCEMYTGSVDVDGLTKYSFDLYKLQYDDTQNSVFSPFSFRVLLSILYQSSFDSTEELFRSKLYFGDKAETLTAQQDNLNRIFNTSSITLANKIYLRDDLKLNPSFSRAVNKYRSDVDQVDFKQSKSVAAKMNKWVEENTNGLIKDLVAADSVTENTVMFIINALYFKARWQSVFSSEIKSNFHNIDGTISETKFLTKTKSYLVASDDILKADIIEIPYAYDSGLVFWILLPKLDSSLTYTVQNLDSTSTERIKNLFTYVPTKLKMPEFKISTEIDGNELFTKFGLGEIFNVLHADILEGRASIAVSKMKQKTTISVDINGTEAATASYGQILLTSSGFFQEDVPFIVDRPFMYAILTSVEHEPLFVGHYLSAK